jgi:hypothetical protein
VTGYRILVTGSRYLHNYQGILTAIITAVVEVWHDHDQITIIAGHARGTDRIAEHIGARLDLDVESFLADWKRYNRRAGGIRNQKMVDRGAHICLAFFLIGALNDGTTDCVIRARKAGIPVRPYLGDQMTVTLSHFGDPWQNADGTLNIHPGTVTGCPWCPDDPDDENGE